MANRIKIALIDYGMGNLRSVNNAFNAIGVNTVIATNPQMLCNAHGIILPGVGAFPAGMNNLQRLGFLDVINEEVLRRAKPILGICLGMQLLATIGSEHGICSGLNLVQGEVVHLASLFPNGQKLRIPHIGWNDLRIVRDDGLFAGIKQGENFYFVHSYIFKPKGSNAVSATCHHGIEFVASLEMDNISAVQFHPEKSHRAGMQLLGNWLRKVGAC